jgi:D-alanyl-D-alanine carboxypeptidase
MQRFFDRFFFIFYLFSSLVSCSVSKQISKEANNILINDTAIRTGHIGISIYEPATGKYWYNYNAGKYFVPASNTKLFTLYAGMKYLGDSLPGLKYARANDTIYAFPTGDPTFCHPDFREQPVSTFLDNNHLPCIFSNSNWKAEKYGAGWAWDDHNESYMPERSALPISGNVSEQKIPFVTNGITTALGILHNKYPLVTSTPIEFNIQNSTFKIISYCSFFAISTAPIIALKNNTLLNSKGTT